MTETQQNVVQQETMERRTYHGCHFRWTAAMSDVEPTPRGTGYSGLTLLLHCGSKVRNGEDLVQTGSQMSSTKPLEGVLRSPSAREMGGSTVKRGSR